MPEDGPGALRIRTRKAFRGVLCQAGFPAIAAFAACAGGASPVLAESAAPSPAILSAGSPAFAACTSDAADAVPLVAETRAWTFKGANGAHYFAADLRPFPDEAGLGAVLSDPRTGAEQLLALPAAEPNRWGLVPAWIVRQDTDGSFLFQADLLERGEALFAPDAATGDCADQLRAAESAARQAGSGHWGGDAGTALFSSWEPETFSGHDGHYVIARGRVVSLGKTAGTRYLNFGRHWKTDLTVTFSSSDESTFNTALGRTGHTVDALEGQRVEVRGVLQESDGPYIALRHPEQLVVLEGKKVGSGGQDGN